jgi:hypothetical protein
MKWVYEYSQKIAWERNRFMLDRIEVFRQKESTKVMQTLLDWNRAKIDIDGTPTVIDDDILYGAFFTHDKKSDRYTALEFKLRKTFDEYFDDLSEFVRLIDAGLIDEKNLRLFLRYWINILNGKSNRKSKVMQEQIHRYLLHYGYDELYSFLMAEKDGWKILIRKPRLR